MLRYLERTTGYSRQQVTRLVRRYLDTGELKKRYKPPVNGFPRKYPSEDVALLTETDNLHEDLSGPAMVHLMQREYHLYGDRRYERLAGISVAHLYNLRKRAGYRNMRQNWKKTKRSTVPTGKRRAPVPDGRPGFIRIDSVHQGDRDAVKGVYHINAVDCVTQWELVACCEKIFEAFLLPVLKGLLEEFPFEILGFHSDNGTEYINSRVADLLVELRFTFLQGFGLVVFLLREDLRKVLEKGLLPLGDLVWMDLVFGRYLGCGVLSPQGFKHDLGLEFRIITLSHDGDWSLLNLTSAEAMVSP